MKGDDEPLRLLFNEPRRENSSFHPWFAMRRRNMARAAVALTVAPHWLSDPDKLAFLAAGDRDAIAAITQDRNTEQSASRNRHRVNSEKQVLDLCSGIGTVAAMAVDLGFDATAVEISIIPHFIDRVLHEFAVTLAAPSAIMNSAGGESTAWRGLVIEIEEFAGIVWDGARVRLGTIFEEDLDIRLWARVVSCPQCGSNIPVIPSKRLAKSVALSNPSGWPQSDAYSHHAIAGLQQTQTSIADGTLHQRICTCPTCALKFPLKGNDLIPLAAVPLAMRMQGSQIFDAIKSPGPLVGQMTSAANAVIRVSTRVGDQEPLDVGQSLFHDTQGNPVCIGTALLPSQRAYFVALADSMHDASEVLARRTALTDEHRLAVRIAVGLLISGQVGYVNAFTRWLMDKPHPPAVGGRLIPDGLFVEVGGAWMESLWRNQLRRLKDLIQQNSTAPRAVRAIEADAAAVPLADKSMSAVIWDPPYYDNIDYDCASEPYQAILAAMLPDLVNELRVPPKLPRRWAIDHYQLDLVRQAQESRRVLSPDGHLGVFWVAQDSIELELFLRLISQVGLQLVRALRLDNIRASKGLDNGSFGTYLLILRPIGVRTPQVMVDAEKVLALATEGVLSLYDGLAELLESVLDPSELSRLISEETQGSARQRLAAFLAGHPEPEQVFVELGRVTLRAELVNLGIDREDLNSLDVRGLARLLLGRFGFAVARPVRFSIRQALRECAAAESSLKLADSIEAVRGAFLTSCNLIERIFKYTSFAWSHLARGDQWDQALEETISSASAGKPYSGSNMLTFGQYELLFSTLADRLGAKDDAYERARFGKIARVFKKAKVHDKLTALVSLRNAVEHDKEEIGPLSLAQLRQRCGSVLKDACGVLRNLDSQGVLPVTVRPEEERRDRYGRRVLRLLEPEGAAIEVHVGSETDLTEPLIYFASADRRDVDPKFLRASTVEALLGLA